MWTYPINVSQTCLISFKQHSTNLNVGIKVLICGLNSFYFLWYHLWNSSRINWTLKVEKEVLNSVLTVANDRPGLPGLQQGLKVAKTLLSTNTALPWTNTEPYLELWMPKSFWEINKSLQEWSNPRKLLEPLIQKQDKITKYQTILIK